MGFSTWLGQNWLSLLQSVGVIASLLITAHALREDSKARQLSNLILLTGQHRDVWKHVYHKPELKRVVNPAAHPKQVPPTEQEVLFVTMIALHMSTVHQAMKRGLVSRMGGVRADVGRFFRLPVPQAVWEKIKPLQEEEFVRFVEECLSQR